MSRIHGVEYVERGYTGILEKFEALHANFTRVIPHSRDIGMVVDQLDASGATAHLPFRPDWLGDTERGLIHTGVITTLVDTISGLAALCAAQRFEPMPRRPGLENDQCSANLGTDEDVLEHDRVVADV